LPVSPETAVDLRRRISTYRNVNRRFRALCARDVHARRVKVVAELPRNPSDTMIAD
jgi:hypothetical protein